MAPADFLNEAAATHAPGCLAEELEGFVHLVGPSGEVARLVELVDKASPGWLRPARLSRSTGGQSPGSG